MSRSFTVEAIYRSGKKLRKDGGRYISETPANAAKKAFSQVFRNMSTSKKSGRVALEVHMRETTSGSAHKIFKYRVSKINDETEVEINGETVVYKYVTRVKAI
jgi:hypothetical protein